MERAIETLMLSLRWLLLPLYVALLTTLFAIYAMVGQELWQLATGFGHSTDIQVVVLVCAVLDLILIANLVVMVAVSSYESFISRIEAPPEGSPEWLGKLDSSNVKVKVAVSVTMISMIHLLRVFLEDDPGNRLPVLAAVHVIFVLSAIGTALIDRVYRMRGQH
jgi:uncharacterized protein (TIGR00645 family)